MTTSADLPADPTSPHASRRPLITWLGIGLIVTAGLILMSLRRHLITRPDATKHHAVGQQLKSFHIAPLVGTETPLDSNELRDHVVLINLWGPWCPPCRRELPELAALANTLSSNPDFRLLAVAVPYDESEQVTLRDDVQRFLQSQQINLPIYADPQRSLRLAAQQAGVYTGSFPTTWLVDRQGTIRAVWKGYLPGTIDDMERLITTLLREQAQSPVAAP